MRRWQSEAAYAAVCAASSVVLTWPLVAVFTSRLGGDAGDPYQTLWSMRWMRDAIFSFQNPFFTPRLHHPHGATLVFQTFDIPSAVLVAPLWDLVPEVAVYNTAVLFAFTLTAYGMFRLARELTGDVVSALLAGILFSAVPYHIAHMKGHLHLTSMGWLPLALVYFVRIIRGAATRGDAVLGGLFLALASLASWYHLLFGLILVPALLAHGAVASRLTIFSARFLRTLLVSAATYILVAGPLLAAILVMRAREEISGTHDPVVFSADLYAFVFPNAAQSWHGAFGAHFARWSGNSEETAVYAGASMLALAVVGARSSVIARAFLAAAAIGTLLALGPYLHVDGHVFATRLPYWYLEATVPPLAFMGVPVRFGYVMYLGLAAAAACGLASLRRRGAAVAPWLGIGAILVPFALALYEYRPRPLYTWSYPLPAPIRGWASDPGGWAVLDATDEFRELWHGTIHRKPMIGGYLSRAPRRLDDWMHQQPIVAAIRWPGGLDTRYQRRHAAVSGLGREAGRAALRDLAIRYVITGDTDNLCVQRELELPRVYAGEGVRIYEVPRT